MIEEVPAYLLTITLTHVWVCFPQDTLRFQNHKTLFPSLHFFTYFPLP